jgi:hypothetical protein
MSLSTQLSRGMLALPMLLLFAVLGVTALQTAEADAVQVVRVEMMSQLCKAPGARSPTFVLAQAPGDLGRLAIRWNRPCRG